MTAPALGDQVAADDEKDKDPDQPENALVAGDPHEPLVRLAALGDEERMGKHHRQGGRKSHGVEIVGAMAGGLVGQHCGRATSSGINLTADAVNRFPTKHYPAVFRRERGSRRLPRVAEAVSSSAKCAAVLMIAVCEKACGKLPRSRLACGSYSSDMRPRSFLTASRRSNQAIASSRRPIKARLLASQKLQGRNIPSCGGSPSVSGRVG